MVHKGISEISISVWCQRRVMHFLEMRSTFKRILTPVTGSSVTVIAALTESNCETVALSLSDTLPAETGTARMAYKIYSYTKIRNRLTYSFVWKIVG